MPELQNGRTAAQEIFTTGQIARICRVSPRTVAKWTDRGRLPCYHLPDCNDRRIHRADLIAFLIANRLPLGELEVLPPLVILCGLDNRMAEAVGRMLTAAPTTATATNGSAVLHPPPVAPEIAVAADGYELGRLVGRREPAAAVIDAMLGRQAALSLGRRVRAEYSGCKLVGLASEDETWALEWGEWGYQTVLNAPAAAESVALALADAAGRLK